GGTLRHVRALADGLRCDGREPADAPGTRRIYSNTGIEVAADHVGAASGMPFAEYFASVWGFPLGGSPAHGVVLPLTTLLDLARELMAPRRLTPRTVAGMVTAQVPALGGV